MFYVKTKHQTMNSIFEQKNEEYLEQDINILEIVMKYLSHWKWFVLSLVISISLCFLYLRYTTPIYQVKTSVMIKDDRRGGGTEMRAFQSLGMIDVNNNVDNELEVLKTVSLMESVVRKMGIYILYYTSGQIKTVEIYGNECPVLFSLPEDRLNFIPDGGYEFDIKIQPNGRLYITGMYAEKEFEIQANRYDSTVVLPFATFKMRSGILHLEKPMDITVQIRKPIAVAQGILSQLNVSLSGKTTSVVNIDLKTAHIQKAKDLLKTYIDVYIQDNMKDQNMIAQNTATFIENRLATLTSELSSVEQKVENYKQREQLTDIPSNAQMLLNQSKETDSKRLDIETQLSIIKDLETYINRKGKDNQLLPAGTGIQNSSLNELITNYNMLALQRKRLSQTATEKNQAMIDLTYQIDALATNIKASISREKRNLTIMSNDINRQYSVYESRVNSIPRQEREYMEIQRQQSVKSALYLFLLQKKEENYLTMTGVVPKARMIDQPLSSGAPVTPKRSMVLFIALLLGLAIPVIIIFIREALKFYVEKKSELEKITKVPILGEIPKSEESGNIVLHENSTDTLAEMFRLLRSNLLFISSTGQRKVILMTSSVGGEGKTFMCINLGLCLAFLNKKVLVIGLDLRKPKLADYLALDNKTGMTMYLSGHTEMDKLIRPSGLHKNFDIIPAGPIPPNPNELLTRPELGELISLLKEQYDYIILDTAPVGAVSDTFSLNRFADISLYIVRAEYTHKQNIAEAEEIYSSGKLNQMYFILNASNIKKASYRYGYGKKYGYGYGYGERTNEK